MILDEIQEDYFKHKYHDVVGVKLLISLDTYNQMLREDERMVSIIQQTSFDSNGELPPMFGRPVFVKHDLDRPWAWSAN